MKRLAAILALNAIALATFVVAVLAQDPVETGVDPTPRNLDQAVSFAYLLTASGAFVAATIITLSVEIVTRVFPAIAARINGAQLAFVFSLILYVLAGIAVGVDSLDEGLVVFFAWLGTLAGAIGIDQVVLKGALTRSPTP